jgi:predicted metal-binding membrane protein
MALSHGDPDAVVHRITLPIGSRLLVLLALGWVIALAWTYLVFHMAHTGMHLGAQAIMGITGVPWTLTHFSLTLLMWAVMMVAMKLPSATPMVLTYAAVVHRVAKTENPAASVALFTAGYVLVWSGFSLGATALQWALERTALLSPALVASSPLLGGGLLLLAGVYQWAPLKEFCLTHCRSPLSFIASKWRSGWSGALQMGVRYGLYCVGCCWALMLLLFVGGVMNLLWVAVIAAFVLLEKLMAPGSQWVRWTSGAALALTGSIVLLAFGVQ